MPRPNRRLASIAQTAELLGVSQKTIRRRIADGTLTAYRSGPRLVRIDLDVAEDALLCPIPTAGVR